MDGLSVSTDDRTRLAGALISMTMAHHSAIVQLYDLDRCTSALALVRSMIDCFARSQWLVHLALDEEVRAFTEGTDPPNTLKIVARLEDQGVYDRGSLSAIIPRIWGVVCDFNHGGGRTVIRHLDSESIGPNFEEVELNDVLIAANSWVLVAACALADLVQNPELGRQFIEKGKSLVAA